MSIFEDYFQDKLILIAGVGIGQGLSTAKLLSKFGSKIIAISRHGLPEEIGSKLENVQFINADASNERSIIEIKEKLEGSKTILDGIVNNAGIWEPYNGKNAEPETVMRFLKSNTMSQYNVIFHMKSLMRRGSAIVNIGASRSLFNGNNSGYTISKYAIEEVTRSFSKELKSYGIRVNAILPGAVSKEDTFAKIFPFNFSENAGALDPLSISFITAFLLSPLSHAINGQSISADRGGID
ncbi:SDR family oxidoreductase [Cuniculiplasma sp. SKW4]|uniref:SDR family oxidoreductase n=1 Tax=Cuniculiplasma sp. SKW4 TaxID=3400171 RepID=UPI003FCFDFAC